MQCNAMQCNLDLSHFLLFVATFYWKCLKIQSVCLVSSKIDEQGENSLLRFEISMIFDRILNFQQILYRKRREARLRTPIAIIEFGSTTVKASNLI